MVTISGYSDKADLHTHTSASDGSSSPEQLIDEAIRLGLRAVAVTDHDVIDGIPAARARARGTGLEVVDGVEINTEGLQREVHILGYFIDIDNRELKERLRSLRLAREARAEKIVRRLKELGKDIDLYRVLEIAGDGSVGRPHIGLAMMEKGYVGSVAEAFQSYIGYGAPAYVPRYKIDPLEAIGMVLIAGGVPVYAHPGLADRDELIPDMVRSGLKGIEVFYPDHDERQRSRYKKIADDYGLIMTGGSDYHGLGANFRTHLGDEVVDYRVVEALGNLSNQRPWRV
ncbi:MAG: PHP domain-containing protein [Firmicutes bacterium]|nr:PHP domain-containing protein [Bacillota bacterium]